MKYPKFIPSSESIIEGLIITVFYGVSYFVTGLLTFPFLLDFDSISFRDNDNDDLIDSRLLLLFKRTF